VHPVSASAAPPTRRQPTHPGVRRVPLASEDGLVTMRRAAVCIAPVVFVERLVFRAAVDPDKAHHRLTSVTWSRGGTCTRAEEVVDITM
jgi:hypothetical protein